MKRVYTSQLSLMVGHLKNVLESEGIPCVMRNEYLGGGAGELPPTECWPELWVEDDVDYEKARRIVGETLKASETPGDPWACPRCGEHLEGQFDACWHCGAERPS
jgi:hypothetical protein